jgi:hypothetical protein
MTSFTTCCVRWMRIVLAGALVMVTLLLPGCTSRSPRPGPGSAPAVGSATSVPSGFSSGGPSATSPPSMARTSTSGASGVGVLACRDAIDPQARPGPLDVVLGVVALPASPGYPALATARTGQPGPLRLFAKTGLLVKAGASFRLSVAAGFAQHARIGWGSPARPDSQFDGYGCANPGGGWSAFAGGYWIDRPACLPIIVSGNGHQQTVHVGLGTPCSGQSPPQPPTES